MTATRRRLAVRTGALALVTALGMSACADGGVDEGAFRAGAAAIVGDDRVSSEQLSDVVKRGLSDPTAIQKIEQAGQRPEYERQQLTRLINSIVVAAVAEERGLTVSDGEVDRRLEQFAAQAGGREALDMQAAQNGIAPEDVRPFVRDLVINDAIGDDLVKDEPVPPGSLQQAYKENLDNYDQVNSAHILVKDKATADRILAQVKADPSTFAAQAKQFSIDPGSKDKGGELGFSGRSKLVKPFSDAIFGAAPNTYVSVKTEFGYHVIHVKERKTTTLEQATPELRRAALKEKRDMLLGSTLKAKADALGVVINPRFGKWDAEGGTVVAAESDTSVVGPDDSSSQAPGGPQPGQPQPGQPQPGQPQPGQPQPGSPPAGS